MPKTPRAQDVAFGEWLASIRADSGLTQQAVAAEMSRILQRPIPHSTVGHWEVGNILRNYDVIPAYASALGVSIDELLRVSLTSEGYRPWMFPGKVPSARYGLAFAAKVRAQMRKPEWKW